jgi:hypothetical protein
LEVSQFNPDKEKPDEAKTFVFPKEIEGEEL